jgi:Phage capsid family
MTIRELGDLNQRYEMTQRACEFGSIAKMMLATRGQIFEGRLEIKKHSPRVARIINDDAALQIISRAATAAQSFANSSALADYRGLAAAFLSSLASVGVFDRLLNGGMRRIPLGFATAGSVTATMTAGYLAEGSAKAVSTLSLASQLVNPLKAAGLLIVSRELAKEQVAEAESLINQELRFACARAVDVQFLAIAQAGAPSFSLTGSTATAFRQALVGALLAVPTDTRSRLYLIVPPTLAKQLAVVGATSVTGQPAFEGVTYLGGNIGGVELIVSDAIAANTAMLVDASAFVASSGDVELNILDQATLQFDTAPDSPPTASTSYQNLWQLNLVALVAERFFTVAKVRSNSVAVLTGADLTPGFSP